MCFQSKWIGSLPYPSTKVITSKMKCTVLTAYSIQQFGFANIHILLQTIQYSVQQWFPQFALPINTLFFNEHPLCSALWKRLGTTGVEKSQILKKSLQNFKAKIVGWHIQKNFRTPVYSNEKFRLFVVR